MLNEFDNVILCHLHNTRIKRMEAHNRACFHRRTTKFIAKRTGRILARASHTYTTTRQKIKHTMITWHYIGWETQPTNDKIAVGRFVRGAQHQAALRSTSTSGAEQKEGQPRQRLCVATNITRYSDDLNAAVLTNGREKYFASALSDRKA